MKKTISLFCITVVLLPLNIFANSVLKYSDFQKKPRLVVLIVIDQFRSDYLTRFESQFLKARKANGELGGFRFLMENSAYFPFATYDVFQNMTCPGHAMISTGSRPYRNGINLNEYYDRDLKRMVYCAEDNQHAISPSRLKTTSFSDEYKNAGYSSKVISIALKDRSAVMLGGHRADLALWMDYDQYKWTTSSYYTQKTPDWIESSNKELRKLDGLTSSIDGKQVKFLSKKGLSYSKGIDLSFDLAEKALSAEKLGLNKQTDFLFLSLSTHDMLGHKLGLNSKEMQELTLFEDQRLSLFLNRLKKHLGQLDQVDIYLTADHGVAPTVEYSQSAKIDAGKIDYLEVYRLVNKKLDQEFGELKSKSWIAATKSLNFYYDPEVLEKKKIKISELNKVVQEALKGVKGIYSIVFNEDLANKKMPLGLIGEQLEKQFLKSHSGDFIIIPDAFYMEKDDNLTTHMTSYSYDKTVPLILFGSKFKKGVYSHNALVIDLAPTISFSLGVLSPALNEGQVLPVF
ncbi:MAG: alkaline phosphatase family protein [Pseudobdellovibrio sp.]